MQHLTTIVISEPPAGLSVPKRGFKPALTQAGVGLNPLFGLAREKRDLDGSSFWWALSGLLPYLGGLPFTRLAPFAPGTEAGWPRPRWRAWFTTARPDPPRVDRGRPEDSAPRNDLAKI